MSTSQAFPQEIVADRYHIQRELGQGGMGAVYAATDLETNQPVAVKILHPEYQRNVRHSRRFAREVRALKKVDHPNVVRVLSAGEDHQGQAYLVMEWVRGPSLAEYIRNQGALSVPELYALALGMSRALREVHRLNIVHRDIKPGNVLIEDGEITFDRIKVCDFGLAKILGDAKTSNPTTQEGGVMGTPAYMAPEQAQTGEVDLRSDVYAFGVVLFEAASGRLPFEADSALAYMMKHVSEPAPVSSEVVPCLPRSVSSLIDACLAKDPETRPQTMEEVVGWLSEEITDRHSSTELARHSFGSSSPLWLRVVWGLVTLTLFASCLLFVYRARSVHSPELVEREMVQQDEVTPVETLGSASVLAPEENGVLLDVDEHEQKTVGEQSPSPKKQTSRARTPNTGTAKPVITSRSSGQSNNRMPGPSTTPKIPRSDPKATSVSGEISSKPRPLSVASKPSKPRSPSAGETVSEPVRDGSEPSGPSSSTKLQATAPKIRNMAPELVPTMPPKESVSSSSAGPASSSIQSSPSNVAKLPLLLQEVEVIGSVSRAKTVHRLRSTLDKLRKCLSDDDQILVEAVIGFGGRVGKVKVSGASETGPQCVQKVLAAVRWSRPDTGDAELRFRLER